MSKFPFLLLNDTSLMLMPCCAPHRAELDTLKPWAHTEPSSLPPPYCLSVLTHFFSGFSWCSLKTHITHRVTCCGLLSAARSEGKMADPHFRMQLRVTPTKAEVSFHTICSLLPLLPTLWQASLHTNWLSVLVQYPNNWFWCIRTNQWLVTSQPQDGSAFGLSRYRH